MKEMREASNEVDQNWLPSISSLGALKSEVMRIRALTMRAITVDGEKLNATLQTLSQSTSDLAGFNAAYAKNVNLPSEKTAYAQYRLSAVAGCIGRRDSGLW